jgi:predicted RNase H-like HicB family nuclease
MDSKHTDASKLRLPIAIHQEDGVYGVSIPDLPGCISFGDTLDEAKRNAREAAESHLRILFAMGELADINNLTPLEVLKRQQGYENAAWDEIEISLVIKPPFDASMLPAPDEMGFFYHPDLPDTGEDESILPYIQRMGFEASFLFMEHDAPQELNDAWYDGEQSAPTKWVPSVPEGEGWLLAAKYDTEDGPCAMFVRPMEG